MHQRAVTDYHTLGSHRESNASDATLYASMTEPAPPLDAGSVDKVMEAENEGGNRPRFLRTVRGNFCERKYTFVLFFTELSTLYCTLLSLYKQWARTCNANEEINIILFGPNQETDIENNQTTHSTTLIR